MSSVTAAPAVRPGIALSLFGMPLGITGFAGVWTITAQDLGAPTWVPEVLYAVASVIWVVFTGLYVVTAIRGEAVLGGDLRHPLLGPFSAYIPVVAILLTAHYSQHVYTVFAWLCWASVLLLIAVAAKLMAHWLTAGVDLDAVHPGFFIPFVAGANVASIGLSQIGQHGPALGAFGAALFFWVVIGAVIMARLFVGGPLPEPLTPALSAFLAAAATGNLAWQVAHPGGIDQVQIILTGVLIVMVAVQVALLPDYRRLSFSQSWWIFTFPLASCSNYAVRWFTEVQPEGWRAWAWLIVGLTTAFFAYVSGRTVMDSLSRKPS